MKRVLLNDRAAYVINGLKNDDLMQWSSQKVEIADAFSELAKLLNSARNDKDGDLSADVDGVVKVMETLSGYNELLNDIAGINEPSVAYYSVEFPENKERELLPNSGAYKALRKIFDENPEALAKVKVDIDALTMSEAAEMLGMSEKELGELIFNIRQNGKL